METVSRYKELTSEVSRVINAFLSYKNGDTGFYKECIRQWALSDLETLKTGLLSFELEDMRHELYILDTELLKRFCRDIEQRYTPLYDEEIFSSNNKELYSLLTDTHGKGTAVMMMDKLKEIAHLNNIIVGDVCSIIDELQPQRQVPQEPSTERAKRAFAKAVEAGMMEKTTTGYKWHGSKASLSYFVVQVYNPDGSKETPFKALGELFGLSRLDSASNKALLEVKKPQKWREKIDELINDLLK
ncbi:MAG: hypothetical protein IJM66_12120 [Muribaculaceae bacterium]|nr:hypothetical protein [Muribaculaceae bacterium]